ncbi:MAG: GNAT family N-acetyltransferase [Anaerolineales bacterium]
MKAINLHDKRDIYQHLKLNVPLHIYSIGDLDDFFWPFTTYYGLVEDEQIREIALLYSGHELPVLLAFSNHPQQLGTLLEMIKGLLPPSFYAHLSPTVHEVFRDTYHLTHHGEHLKMALVEGDLCLNQQADDAGRIPGSEIGAVLAFYKKSYPENWFDPRMLETGQYFGIKKGGEWISIGGVHVYSPTYNVAAIGNVATHPQHRNKGYATQVTARLCQSLSKEVDTIGLNVKTNNKAALSCYTKLGFQSVATYHEYTFQKG